MITHAPPRTVYTQSPGQTQALAENLARDIRAPVCLLLQGELGAGKSLFTRALIRALTGTPDLEVPSPTFTLLQTYETPHGPLYHFDLYRLEHPDEIYELGWEDAIADGIVCAEWPERLGPLTPEDHIRIKIDIDKTDETRRALTFIPHGKTVLT